MLETAGGGSAEDVLLLRNEAPLFFGRLRAPLRSIAASRGAPKSGRSQRLENSDETLLASRKPASHFLGKEAPRSTLTIGCVRLFDFQKKVRLVYPSIRVPG